LQNIVSLQKNYKAGSFFADQPVMKYLQLFLLIVCLSFCSYAQQYDETGKCTYYADKFQGQNTTSGEKYDKTLFTAAHRTLPFNTVVEVTNLLNSKSVIVRINDRGPSSKSLLIDLSRAAAIELDMITYGVVPVRIKYIGMANADSVKQFYTQRKQQITPKNQTKKPIVSQSEKTEAGLLLSSYYNQQLVISKPKGYGVQVGYYASLSNCRNTMHVYEARYNSRAYIYVEKSKEIIHYRLIMGQFGSRKSAEEFRKYINKDIPDCFIVTYSSD
jgi:rare lipoprotein A